MVTCKIKKFAKHLQKCFSVLFYILPPVKWFAYVYAKTFANMFLQHFFCKCFSNVEHKLKIEGGYMYNKTFAKHVQKCFRAVDFPLKTDAMDVNS